MPINRLVLKSTTIDEINDIKQPFLFIDGSSTFDVNGSIVIDFYRLASIAIDVVPERNRS